MAIVLEFIDLVIPIARIREAYPGGWEQCLADYALLIGRRVWHDAHLLRDGALNPDEARARVEGWAVLGFEPTGMSGRTRYWKDVCVIDSRSGGSTLPCPWITYDASSRTAHLRGVAPGPLAWRGRPRLAAAAAAADGGCDEPRSPGTLTAQQERDR